MILLATFAAIFVIGQAANVVIAMLVEHFSENASLAAFFAMFAVVVVVGWYLAVWLTDRLFGPEQDQRVSRGASR